MLVVTAAAEDPTLLTVGEVAAAVGDAGASPAALEQLRRRVSGLIADACNVAAAGAAVRTLRAETVTETLRVSCYRREIYLSRGPVIEILSAAEDDVAVDVADFEVDGRTVLRLRNGDPCAWACGRVAISYRAGWPTVPDGLKELASKLAVTLWAERGRDPSLGSVNIPGVIAETYRFGRPDDPLIPEEIMQGLRNGGYVNLQTMVG